MSGYEAMSAASSAAPEEKPKCPICFGTEFEEEGEPSFQALACGHSGHKECLESWIGQGHITCPTCRQPDLRILITKNILFPDLLALMMPVRPTAANPAGWLGIADRSIAFDCAKAIAEKTEGQAGVYYSDHPPDGFDISQLLFMTLMEHSKDLSLCVQALRAFRAFLANSVTDEPEFMLEPLCDAESHNYGKDPIEFMVDLFEYHMNAVSAPLQSAQLCEHLCYILGRIAIKPEGNAILRTVNGARMAAGKQSLVKLLVQLIQYYKGDNDVYKNILSAFQRIVMPNPGMIGHLCELFTSDAFWEHARPKEERVRLFDANYFFVNFLGAFARIFKDHADNEPLCHACIPALIRIDSERKHLYSGSLVLRFTEASPFVIAYERFLNTPGHEAAWEEFRTNFLRLPEPGAATATGAVALNRKASRKACRKTYRKACRKTYRKAYRKTYRKTYRKASRKAYRKAR